MKDSATATKCAPTPSSLNTGGMIFLLDNKTASIIAVAKISKVNPRENPFDENISLSELFACFK